MKATDLNPRGRPEMVHEFRLYVAGEAPHSQVARVNLAALCARYLPGQHAIQIVDVLQQPEKLLEDGIIVTPTLVRVSPAPTLKIVGALTRWNEIIAALGLDSPEKPDHHV